MFTGIVEEVGKVLAAPAGKLVVACREVLAEITLGGSLAVNGVCLTVTRFDDKSFSIDIMPETLCKTNLGLLKAGDEVNLERPLTLQKPLGGHLVQGHIDGTGKIAAILQRGEEMVFQIEAPVEIMRYIVKKGFVAIDGISLTVVDLESSSFRVSLVGFTIQHTNLGRRRVGGQVNIEVDIIAKYVERFSQPPASGVTPELLREHGFLG